ncbi:MAG TPA: TonB-dependent receptor [Hyphomonadaceae bacterium]|nr:TonB-dependent receptor [Hyphomonadaceae bacterium]
MRIKLLCSAAALAGAVTMGLPAGSASAQEGATSSEDVIVVTGTRRAARSAADSPAPIDVIGSEELLDQADTDLQNILRTSVPSFNVNTQPISDAATLIRPANLRGLAPDSTLVLVNNKRRHRAAVITFLGGGLADGSQGADISVIPAIALSQVEVLRDGAASQYGSDAIAGVMNFILRDAPDGGQVEAEWGTSYEGDGTQWSVAGNIGLPLGPDGFVNISAEYGETDATSRSTQRTDAANLIAAGNTAVANPAQIWGQPQVDEDFTIFFNSGLKFNEAAEGYAFGNYSGRTTEGGFFFRNPNNRAGVFRGPRFNPATNNIALLDDNGTPDDDSDDFFFDSVTLAVVASPGFSVSVGDLSVNNTGDCPAYLPLSGENGLPDPTVLTNLQADPNCFSFVERFPGGFTPRFGGELEDKSIVLGVRGELAWGSGLTYDVSYSYGRNDIDFSITNTVNASLGPNSPTSFNPGGYSQIEENFNIDFSYGLDLGLASPLNVAFGAEHRTETFEIRAGDPASFALGPLAAPDGAYPIGQGFSSSSNGFGGFTPESAGENSQDNYAVYLDLEADVTDQLILQGAVRYEDFYDTYGTTTNYKVGALYHLTDDLTLRSTWSTGFRAPTVGQANVTNITTQFSNGQLQDQGTLPLTSAAGQFIADRLEIETGFRPTLAPEESENFTIGAGFRFGGIDVTVDYFHIEVTDRIAISDQQDFVQRLIDFANEAPVTPFPPNPTTAQLLILLDTAGKLNAADFAGSEELTSFGFFTNSFDTETQGIDIVASTRFELYPGSESQLSAAFNWTETDVTNTGANTAAPLSAGRQYVIENGLPDIKGNVTFNHQQGPFSGLARLNYYGEYFECHLDEYGGGPTGCALSVPGDAQITFDFELGYDVTENATIALGAQNAFDSFPDENPFAGIAGSKYPATAPAGFLGGFYYVRARTSF